MSREKQRGIGKIKAILTLLIVLLLAYGIFQVAPAYMDNFWVQDEMTTQARFAVTQRRTEDDVREAIWKVVKEREIHATPPIKREDIRVEYTGRSINVSLRYTVVINLYVYQFPIQFTPNAGDRAL
jgi:hypothetical protein